MSSAWGNFFVAEAGAAAALAGLLFVAVSINLARIIQYEHLPALAMQSLINLFAVLFVSSLALVPQDPRLLGVEIVPLAVLVEIVHVRSIIKWQAERRKYAAFWPYVLASLLPALPFVAAGALLVAGEATGVDWIVPGCLLCFVSGLYGAWVLLVEIIR